MLRFTPFSYSYAVPLFHKHGKVFNHKPNFLQPRTTRKWIDETTMAQHHRDKKGQHLSPLTRTLHHLAQTPTLSLTKVGGGRTMRGRRGTVWNARAWVQGALSPHRKQFAEWEAPWLAMQSSHQMKQKLNKGKGGAKTSHVVEITASDDHLMSSADSLDRAAMELCVKTESRWPLVQQLVFESFEWWKEMKEIHTILLDSKSSATSSSSSSTATTTTRGSSAFDELDEASIEKRLSLLSASQVRAMKPRTFSTLLQGYTCCLGNFRDFSIEAALIAGFGDHVVALTSGDQGIVGSAGGASARLISLIIQVLFVGLLRHQSVADFRTLGLGHVGELAHHAVGLEKLPNLVANAMRSFLKRNDVDGAIKLGYAACVYCCCCSSNASSSSSSSFGVTSIPINCTARDETRRLPVELLQSHYPYSRPFVTLRYGWGWNHRMCRNIQEISSAAWLLELSTVALVSMVDCPIACGVKKRVLRSIQLVSTSCDRWLQLMINKSKTNETKKLQQQDQINSSSAVMRCGSLSDSEKWSSASILISIKRLGPVLEMLSAVEEQEQSNDLMVTAMNGNVKYLDASTSSSSSSSSSSSTSGQRAANNTNKNDDDHREDEPPNQNATKRNKRRHSIKNKNNFFVCPKRDPLSSAIPSDNSDQSRMIPPTSFSPRDVSVPLFLTNRNKNRISSHPYYNHDDDDDDEYFAASFFAKTMREAAQECLKQIAPYFDVEIDIDVQHEEKKLIIEAAENKKNNNNSNNHSENENNNSEQLEEKERFNVPRSVLAEVADACEFVSTCPVFGKSSSMRKNYEKLTEKMQQIVLS